MSNPVVKQSIKFKSNKDMNWADDARRKEVIEDFKICCLSRAASIFSRREVLMGKANFGIIGDGKEVAQVAMARAWKKGDFRSGYYRDQTLMMALGLLTLEDFFAQLYGDPEQDTNTHGRQMNGHFQSTFCDEEGNWLDLKNRYNVSSDISPTAGQVARGLGLALASKKFRKNPELCGNLSNNGNEIAFVTIGDASTSEGPFWEAMNAAGVMQVPMAVSVWDDGFGISVPQKFQTTKESISDLFAGFKPDHREGIQVYTGKGWDYAGLRTLYEEKIALVRENHEPALFHIQEITQQLGHSTSGDHRRYKTAERLQYELDYDCNTRMANWMIKIGIATQEEIDDMQKTAQKAVAAAAKKVKLAYQNAVQVQKNALVALLSVMLVEKPSEQLSALIDSIEKSVLGMRFELVKAARRAAILSPNSSVSAQLSSFIQAETALGNNWYSTHLVAENGKSATRVIEEKPVFSKVPDLKDGYEILNACFDYHLEHCPQLFAFGEDVGNIGDVNQAFRGMQEKYGTTRVFDTGIREWTIMGQAIGMAMRGLRPIAEIQYLDYLLYGLAPLSDDLATLRWRTANKQQAPAIIRTRGHRLVGVWHSGSPMSLILGSLRGMHLCVPRNMTQAAGMYNTLLQSNDPAIVIECLNGYRLKENLPTNIGTFTVPLGIAEVLKEGKDITIITYGSCVRIAEEAMEMLELLKISVELVDIQTLMPFDLEGICGASVKKTNRVLFFDEDVPGGASAYMMQEVLENQGAYQYLDSKPLTLAAKAHRPAYGQDGDYYSKPQAEDIAEMIVQLMQESGFGERS